MENNTVLSELELLKKAFYSYFFKLGNKIPFGFIVSSTKDMEVKNFSALELIQNFPFLFESLMYDKLFEDVNYDNYSFSIVLPSLQFESRFMTQFFSKNFNKLAIFSLEPINKNDVYLKNNKKLIYIYDIKEDIYYMTEVDTSQEIGKPKKYSFSILHKAPNVLIEANPELIEN
jgi:hypothetical protein